MTVAGSSRGALRAAELWQFGMRGVGEVFRLYRDGVITGNDEVAVVHGPVDDGSPLLSEPLVKIRTAVSAAIEAGAVTADEAQALTAIPPGQPGPVDGRWTW